MADNNPLSIQNASGSSYLFKVTYGSQVYSQQVAAGGAWNVPVQIPCDQFFNVTVSNSAETLSYEVLNAVSVIWDADTLGCMAGACQGGCQVNQQT